MNRDLDELLASTPSTDELMDVDTSFLAAYRRGGGEKSGPLLPRDGQYQEEARRHPVDATDSDPQLRPGFDSETTPPPAPFGDDVEHELGTEHELDADHEPERGDAARSDGAGQHGGGAAGSARTTATPPGSPTDVASRAPEDHAPATVPMSPDAVPRHTTPASLRLTDHQEAVQNTAAAKTGSGSSGDAAALPQAGFRLGGAKSQPHIKSLPETILGALRQELRSAAVRELGVTDTAARDFSDRLSQGTLVMAFLLAQLDLRLDVDPATARATELFRSRDPLLGSVAARLAGLERREAEDTELLRTLHQDIAEVHRTGAVVEQAVAYVIADRTMNFLRGSHDIHDAPVTDTNVVYMRDKLREATEHLARLERDRHGRPIR